LIGKLSGRKHNVFNGQRLQSIMGLQDIRLKIDIPKS